MLKYSALYRFALRMDTDPVRTALDMYFCSEFDSAKSALLDVFIFYELNHYKVFDLEEEVVAAGKRAGCTISTSMSLNLHALLAVFQSEVPRASTIFVQRGYNENCGERSDPQEAKREAGADGLCLKELVEQQLLWNHAANTDNVTEEALSWTWQLIQAVFGAVSVTKKDYVGLVRDLAGDLQAMRWGAEATTDKLAEREAKWNELDLKATCWLRGPYALAIYKTSGNRRMGA